MLWIRILFRSRVLHIYFFKIWNIKKMLILWVLRYCPSFSVSCAISFFKCLIFVLLLFRLVILGSISLRLYQLLVLSSCPNWLQIETWKFHSNWKFHPHQIIVDIVYFNFLNIEHCPVPSLAETRAGLVSAELVGILENLNWF